MQIISLKDNRCFRIQLSEGQVVSHEHFFMTAVWLEMHGSSADGVDATMESGAERDSDF